MESHVSMRLRLLAFNWPREMLIPLFSILMNGFANSVEGYTIFKYYNQSLGRELFIVIKIKVGTLEVGLVWVLNYLKLFLPNLHVEILLDHKPQNN